MTQRSARRRRTWSPATAATTMTPVATSCQLPLTPTSTRPVTKQGDDEGPHHRAEHVTPASEETGASDDDGSNGVELIVLTGQGRGVGEVGHDHHPCQARQQSGDRVDPHQVVVNADAGASCPHAVAAYGIGPQPETGAVQDQAHDHAAHRRHQHRDVDPASDQGLADGADLGGKVDDLVAAVDQRGRPRPDGGEGAQGDDEGGQLEPGDEVPVDKADEGAQRQGGRETGHGRECHVGVRIEKALHDDARDHACEAEHGPVRKVDATSDDHEGLTDGEQQELHGVLGDVQPAGSGEQVVGGREEPEDQDHDDEHAQHPVVPEAVHGIEQR